MNGVARDMQDPETKLSVWQRSQLRQIERARSAKTTARKCASAPICGIDALGSGSDYTAFIDHWAVASLNVGYGGEDEAGIYHSVYDDFYWYTHFADTDFVYGRALSQTVGTAVMRLADADCCPLNLPISPIPFVST